VEFDMCSLPHPLLSPEAYLAAERAAEYKTEYFAGEIFAMTGASREHNLVATNCTITLGQHLRGRPCELYAGDMRVKISRTGSYVYPDVVIACGQPEFEDEHVDTLLNPTVVIEVLSPSTERYDRGRKWEQYRQIPALAEYLLIAQDQPLIEHYARQQSGFWLFSDAKALDESVDLVSVGCTLPLAEVYDRVF
jgi:Uma2 family endonuclease